MTTITITEDDNAGRPSIERLKMQLDAAPTPDTLNRIIGLLTAPVPTPKRVRSDKGTKRGGKVAVQ